MKQLAREHAGNHRPLANNYCYDYCICVQKLIIITLRSRLLFPPILKATYCAVIMFKTLENVEHVKNR